MAGPIIIPNCVEVRLKWQESGILFFNVLHAQYTLAGPLSPTVAETVFAAVKGSAAGIAWAGFQRNSTSFLGIGIRDIRAANNPELLSTGGALVGTSANGELPRQTAITITLRTALAGKQFRGRVYLGGLATNTSDPILGTIAPAANTAGVNFVAAVQTALAAQSMTLAIGQKFLPARNDKHGNPLPARPANVVPVTAVVSLNTRFDTQRRRLQ